VRPLSPRHHVTTSPSHQVTKSPCHHVTLPFPSTPRGPRLYCDLIHRPRNLQMTPQGRFLDTLFLFKCEKLAF
jgi:hypothetical protein